MYTEEKKKSTNYGTIFVYCFFCFVLVVEVARFAKPYYNLQNMMETEAVVEEAFLGVEKLHPCNFKRSSSVSVPARNHQKFSSAITESKRKLPPTSYCVKFESTSKVSKMITYNGDKYESRPFSAGGYNWTFILYPNFKKPGGGTSYGLSVYVRIDNSTLIAHQNEVYAWVKFLAYYTREDVYYEYQTTEAQRFHLYKQVYGVDDYIPYMYFEDPKNGYLFNGDQMVFGVDIVVSKPPATWDLISYEENIRDPLLDWRITHFSTRALNSYTSDSFSSGGKNWVLKVYPNGVGSATGNSLSLYLLSASNEQGYVKAKLRIVNQDRSNNVEKLENGWGFDEFIPLADIRDATKGFLVNDTLKIEVEIVAFSKTDSIYAD